MLSVSDEARFSISRFMECRARLPALFRLDIGRPDHLGPLFGFLGDELAELGGRTGKYRAAQVSEPRLQLGIGEPGVNLLVELVGDLYSWVRRRHTTRSRRSPAGNLPRSAGPAAAPSASWSLPP